VLLVIQYARFSATVEQRLRGERGSVPSRVYARPLVLRPGLQLDAAFLANALNGLRYSERPDDATEAGQFTRKADGSLRFFITSLGNPRWVVDRVSAAGGKVYHDITERKWAQKAMDGGVHGLICVNSRAGGHAGRKTPRELLDECGDLGLPLVCAGGVGDAADFVAALALGYAGVQMGTRFIATTECSSREDYKQAIVDAGEDDIALTERVTGVPIAVIRTPYVERIGTTIGPISRWLFRGRKTKHYMRMFYALRSLRKMKHDSVTGSGTGEYWQAGRSVAGIHGIEPAGDVVRRFKDAAVLSSGT